MASLINLVTDICQRNNIRQLVWSDDKNTRIQHLNGANMTVHRDFSAKACPGEFLMERMGLIAFFVNARLNANEPVATAPITKVESPVGVYPAYTGNTQSIVTALAAVGERNTSFANRKAIALANGIGGYTGTASQNIALLNKLKAGQLVKVGGASTATQAVTAPSNTYPAYNGGSDSIVSALGAIGEKDTSFNHRAKIAAANGIGGYRGTAGQNLQMVKLLRQGQLKRA